MLRNCRVEIAGPLPAGVRDELSRRFGPVRVRRDRQRTVVTDLSLDQAGLRALLDLLWDAGAQVHAVTTADPDDRHPADLDPPRVDIEPGGAPPPGRGRDMDHTASERSDRGGTP